MKAKSEYRKALGQFATGVTIITTRNEGENFGFTANSFTSVSLDPPLVLFCINKEAYFLEAQLKSKVFGINILSKQQEGLSNKFANPAIIYTERFDGVSLTYSPLNNPIIENSLAFLDCELVKTSKAGTHMIILGKVKSFDRYSNKSPLIYFGGGYNHLKE